MLWEYSSGSEDKSSKLLFHFSTNITSKKEHVMKIKNINQINQIIKKNKGESDDNRKTNNS